MIYIIGLILSFIYCGQLLSSEIQSRNTFHMKNGDKPNAFVTLFPNYIFNNLLAIKLFFPSNCDQSFMYLIYLPIYFLGYQF